jgi:mannose-6-phosphate isomerase-like protein (cupin superfamily)
LSTFQTPFTIVNDRENEMIKKIERPTIIKAAGNKPKRIEEYIGRVNSGTTEVSIARLISPQGWIEPEQKPEFDEYTVVLKGALRLKLRDGELEVHAGEAVVVGKNESVQYSTPYEGGAEYIAVCQPAFSPETVHRDPE